MSVSDATLPVAHDDEAPYQSIESIAHDLRIDSNVKSPYVDTEIISLDVGPTQTRYRVHRAILAQSSELDAKPSLKLWGEKTHDAISLPELDEMTAHTIVHYLYTGRYNTLESRDLEGRSTISQYKLSTCAYCAAIRYKLPGLAELAKQTIVSLQEDLTILDVLIVAREHAFPLLPEDEAWFSEYLESAIHAAVTKDAGLFTRPGFVDQVEGDRRYRQVVMKAIVNTYSRGPAAAPSTNSEKYQRASTLSPVVAIANHDVDTMSMTTPETLLEEINPTLDTHLAPEPYTDELGWESSMMYRTQRMGTQSVADVPTPSKSGHARVDSFTEDEPTAPASVATTEATAPVPVLTTETTGPASVATTEATAPAPVQTTEATAPAPVPTTEPASDTAASPIVNGADINGTTAKKNKRKKKKNAAAAAASAVGVVSPVTANPPAAVVAN